MAERVRGALNAIDWSVEPSRPLSSNETSINTGNRTTNLINRSDPSPQKPQNLQPSYSPEPRSPRTHSQTPIHVMGDVPANPYPSVVAPVTTKNSDPVLQHSSRRTLDDSDDEEEAIQFYVGYLGSLQVTASATGIGAIQKPMRELYYPYRCKQVIAQERVLNVYKSGVQVVYMTDPLSEEPSQFFMLWSDIVYVEALKYSTKKSRDKKSLIGAFEPCEAERNALLGNRDNLYCVLEKEHKHIAKLSHPALLTIVVRNSTGVKALYTQGYACSTVEESVYLARMIRAHIDVTRSRKSSVDQTQQTTSSTAIPYDAILNPSLHSSDPVDNVFEGFKFAENSGPNRSQGKTKNKSKSNMFGSKKKDMKMSTYGEASLTSNLEALHFGMSLNDTEQEEFVEDDIVNEALQENFIIGKPKPNQRNSGNRTSTFESLEIETGAQFDSNIPTQKPIAMVQPQVTNLRDAYKVLPTDRSVTKSHLKPTALQIKNKNYSNTTPELDSKLKQRQFEMQEETTLSPLGPRSVVNPIADDQPMKTSWTPKPTQVSRPMQWQNAALPDSGGWHEAVIGNFQKKEKVQSKVLSETVDKKQLPKLEKEKKEQEIANLFSTAVGDSPSLTDQKERFSALESSLGYLP